MGSWWTLRRQCLQGSVTSGPTCVDGPTHVETTKSSIQCKRTRGQLGIKLLQRYLQEPESPHRFDLHWRNCVDCPKESRPPIRARSSSLKYPVLSWKKSVPLTTLRKKIPWSLHQQVVYRRCHQPGGKKNRARHSVPHVWRFWSDGTRKGWPDAQHVVPDDLTSHEIDNLIEEFLGCLLFATPGLDLAGAAPFHTFSKRRTTGLRPLHTRRS